jgi:beta-lactamase class D
MPAAPMSEVAFPIVPGIPPLCGPTLQTRRMSRPRILQTRMCPFTRKPRHITPLSWGVVLLLAACTAPPANQAEPDEEADAPTHAATGPVSGLSLDFEVSPALTSCVEERGFGGTVLIADPARGSGWFGPDTLIDTPLLPASTFKIASTLMALDAGLVEGGETVLPWDGVVRSREETNQPLELAAAFRISAVPHYQALVRALGEARVAAYLQTLDYGNRESSGGTDTFWLTGGLRITPREQIDFLARLAAGTLALPPSVMAETRKIMLAEEAPGAILRAKTGLTTPPEGETVGWWVGWVEREEDAALRSTSTQEPAARATTTYLFATALTTSPPAPPGFAEARLEVTRCALRALAIFP